MRAVVKKTLGTLDALSVEDARQAGRALLAETRAETVPTMRRFAPSFLADCAERWKPATRATYAHIVRRWFDGIAATHPGSANWALAAMSSKMKHAETLALRPDGSNPCRGLRRRRTGFEAHYLTDDEFAALGRALDGAEADHRTAVAALRFLLYTGVRKSEALRLRWEQVHGDRAVLPDSKTGPRPIRLASPALLRSTSCRPCHDRFAGSHHVTAALEYANLQRSKAGQRGPRQTVL